MRFLLFSFDSYLLNVSSNFTQMVTIESLRPGLSDRRKNGFSRLNNKRVRANFLAVTSYVN